MDGQAPSERFQMRSNHTGPSGKSWQWNIRLSWRAPTLLFQQECQATLHLYMKDHLKLGKCKLRTKDTVYWPGLNDQLAKWILNCELCLKYSHSKHKQKPNITLGQCILGPSLPLTFFIFKSASYMLMVDYTSRFPVVCKLSSMTGQHIAN